jgi:acyl-coenzyme A thioesterase PaaI-like protein
MAPPKLTADELHRLLDAEFPQMFSEEGGLSIEHTELGACRVRQAFRASTLRPGGTISGVAMMGLTDVSMYIAVLASIGWVPLAVTTNLSINFLRKPAPRDLLAECRLLKVGKRLAAGEVTIRSEGFNEPVAHALSTYSIPAESTA